MSDPSEEYRRDFHFDDPNSKVAEEALKIALDTRKFEIGLYWHRTAYFWALITAAFAGFFAVLSSPNLKENQRVYAFAVACVGFLFSLAWFLVNRGSKFWQENWENHVDLLEDRFAGPLFKTILYRSKWRLRDIFDGPAPISVSKVNQYVSLFIMLIWLFLASTLDLLPWEIPTDPKYLAGLTAAFAVVLIVMTRTHRKGHKHRRIRKSSQID
jgi:hypothetical protein